jgi:hypothetical protein
MRGRAFFHSAGFVSAYLKASYLSENNFFERCLIKLWKHVLPTLLILICGSVITLFLSGLIAQAKLEHGSSTVGTQQLTTQSLGSKIP